MGTLQQVQVPIIDQSACQEMFQIQPTEEVNIRYDMLCAGFQQGGKDSCQVILCVRGCALQGVLKVEKPIRVKLHVLHFVFIIETICFICSPLHIPAVSCICGFCLPSLNRPIGICRKMLTWVLRHIIYAQYQILTWMEPTVPYSAFISSAFVHIFWMLRDMG